jgi:FAD:protein FMN transferase
VGIHNIRIFLFLFIFLFLSKRKIHNAALDTFPRTSTMRLRFRMPLLTLARQAMATRFELVLAGANEPALRAAGEEALHEIDQLEAQLSLYQPTSEIARVNARAAREPVRVSPRVFGLLDRAGKLSQETGGAFDITIAPLVRCWGFMGGTGRMPTTEEIEKARSCVGMRLVELDAAQTTVRFHREGVMIDLGAIGKGYAIEQAVEILRDAGVTSALLHGGTSTVYGLGAPPDEPAWNVAVHDPDPKRNESLTTVQLKDQAMSVSAVWGRSFEIGGKTLGHVLDPRTGYPAANAILSAVSTASATDSDALSTALLVRGAEGYEQISALRSDIRSLVVAEIGGKRVVKADQITRK